MVNECFAEINSRPQMVRLEHNLLAICFSLMKAVSAFFVVRRILEDNPGVRRIVETSSGTAAHGLAKACCHLGVALKIVSDPAVDKVLAQRLRSLDVDLHIVEERHKYLPGGYQEARLTVVREALKDPGTYWSSQYHNKLWRLAYRSTAAQLIEDIGVPDMLVAAVGSGASGCGTFEGLRIVNPDIELHGVDTPGSVIFGSTEKPRNLRGLGNSLIPKNTVPEYFTRVYWVTNAEAWTAAYALNSGPGAGDVGPTSGAAWLAARYLAKQNPSKIIAFICPDDARRYEPDINSPETLKATGRWADELPTDPVEIGHPHEVTNRFSTYHWDHQSLEQVQASAPGVQWQAKGKEEE
jgi:cysteine synthase A